MFIKEIVIDGFKSYAQRTEVKGFDPLFNAITGLNGSGKSNILDSICFLLGISNLTQVRAGSLQELVYKGGQAGVTKATVTITFDNRDKKQSPLGYETFDEITVSRQVVIGGRNKYLINGSNANNSRVQDLFCSVQLNVNNPHFLIMQGRITKVLNMKPPEILSMIEEAAGTRMYENKKASAQKTIEKKDAKLKEIDSILSEEITPTLTRLKDERSNYLEYQKVMRELEHLSRLHIAYQFLGAEEMSKKSADDLAKMADQMNQLREKLTQIDNKICELSRLIKDLEKMRDKEAGGALMEIEKTLAEKQNADTKMQSSVHHKQEALAKEKKNRKALLKSYEEDQVTLKSKEKDIDKNSANFDKVVASYKENMEGVAAAQKHLQAVSAGLSSSEDGGEAKTLADQLMACKTEMNLAETACKQAESTLKTARSELKGKQSELKKTEKDYQKDTASLEAMEKGKVKLEAEMKKLGFEDGKEDDLVNQRKTLAQQVDHLNDKVNNLTARFPNLQFDYKDPEKNFDRSKVHGLVARLISVKDARHVTALEVTAGRKLYNVVVDTEVTSKQLLQKGELKRRYTIIPLNKIAGRSLDQDKIKAAENLVGKTNVHSALSLVGYEKNVQAAMQFIFGSAMVCQQIEHAKKVTFDPKIKTRTVTLAGDTFDPSGTLTGGARAKGSTILSKLTELQDVEGQLRQKEQELAGIDKQLKTLSGAADKFRQLKEQYELKVHEATLVQDRLRQSTHHKQLEDVRMLEASIAEQQATIPAAKERQKELKEKCKTLEARIQDAAAYREKELKEAESGVSKAKKKAEETNKAMKLQQQEMDTLRLEVEDLRKELSKYDDQIASVDEAISGLEEQVKELEEKAKETKSAVSDTKKELDRQKELLKERNQDIQVKLGQQRDLGKEDQETQLEMKELDHQMNKHQRDSKDATHKVESLMAKYEWIATEKQYFGQPNTAYDFSSSEPKEVARRLNKLQETKEKLGRNVNMRAMNMLSKAEEKYNDLMKKKRIVENDKKKIMATIQELDEKKNAALKEAWAQVNKDFGSIFSTLLPGTQAKLQPLEGHSILDGLEVKVAFGDVWKDSLSELSGGQRSLVALSLILSLLLFKPAPLYILDEVDAALDLSHTQNIGQMLRTHFRHSQFIVVSLKDGMFNNANVLFKTKFVDGISTVTRYAQNPSTSASNRLGSAGFGGGVAAGRKKTAGTKKARTEPLAEITQ